MRVLRLIGSMFIFCMTVVPAGPAVSAQRAGGVPQGDRTVLPSALVSRLSLTPDADSDKVIPELTLDTLADGMTVVSGALPKAQSQPVVGRSMFLLVDAQAATYRTFVMNGAVENNERLKLHLKARYGIDWDANRRAMRPRAKTNDAPPEQPVSPIPLRAGRRPPPQRAILPISNLSAQQQLVSTCVSTADVVIESRDILGYGVLLARSRSYAAWTQDIYTNPYFDQRWAFAFNDRQPQAPSALGTNWYLDGGSSQQSNYNAEGLSAHAEQSSTYFNVDFPWVFQVPDLGPTYAWHGITADAHAFVTWIHSGSKNEYGGYSSLIGSNIIDYSWQACF
jgi:hypothetical protein